jgi:hypothetical protein
LAAVLAALLCLLAFTPSAAQAAGGAGPWVVSGSVMGFFNSTKQGGSGPGGSTVLTQVDFLKQWSWYGFGVFGQFDLQGSNERDTGFGPKVEIHHGLFYVEGGWILSLNRSFTDRSIAEQTGFGWLAGAGVRFSLHGGGAHEAGLFLQFSYKYRVQTIKQQDGKALSEPITQTDGYPLFGLGMRF